MVKVKRYHKMMTEELKKQLPPLYSQVEIEDPEILVHYFNPYGRGDWFVIEFDADDRFFGYCCISFCELGCFSLKELEETYVNLGELELPLERDLDWQPKRLSEVRIEMVDRYE